jgi:hypothetical protein
MDCKELPIIGKAIEDNDWPCIEEMFKELKLLGLEPTKIFSFIGGSIKFLVKMDNAKSIEAIRGRVEKSGWRAIAPYFRNGQCIGLKIVKSNYSKKRWG